MPRIKLTYAEAALVVLRQQRVPMKTQDITYLAVDWGLLTSKARFPDARMRATLYTDIKEKGVYSEFRRTARGVFSLAEWQEEITSRSRLSVYLRAALAILQREQQPLRVGDITIKTKELRILHSTASVDTMRARLAKDIADNRDTSVFARSETNTFILRKWIHQGKFQEHVTRYTSQISARQAYVLVIPQEKLDGIGRFQGINRQYTTYYREMIETRRPLFERRKIAEESDSIKQILSYVIVTTCDEKYISFVRGSRSNISWFLIGQKCLGFGGHIEESDHNLLSLNDSGLRWGTERELAEELSFRVDEFRDLKIVGVLSDDTSVVGYRHFGFVFHATLDIPSDKTTLIKGETAINGLTCVTREQIAKDFHHYEYWSQLCAAEFMDVEVREARFERRNRVAMHAGIYTYVIVGEIGNGKTEVCDILAELTGGRRVSTRACVESVLGLTLEEARRLDFSERAEELVSNKEGLDSLSAEVLRALGSDELDQTVVVDGIRHPQVLRRIREARRSVCVIYVRTAPHRAFEFYRQRAGHPVSVDEFRARRQHAVERHVPLLALMADITIYNYGSIESLKRAVKDAIK